MISGTKAVLIIGGSGFIGSHLVARLKERYRVFYTYAKNPVSITGAVPLKLNASEIDRVKRLIFHINPDCIIYSAGSDYIEGNISTPSLRGSAAEAIHALGISNVAGSSSVLSPKIIYLSNSKVFDGKRGNYNETDVLIPSSDLGKSKLGGENHVRTKCSNHVILRLSPVIGFSLGQVQKFGFLDKLRLGLESKKQIHLSNQHSYSFCPIQGVCDAVEALIEFGAKNEVIHYGGRNKLTPFELAIAYAKRFGLNYNSVAALPIEAKGIQYDSSLDVSKMIERLKLQPFLLEESFNLIEKSLL